MVEMSEFWLYKLYPQLNNPYVTIFVAVICLIVIYFIYQRTRGELSTDMQLFYFADLERLVTPLKVEKLSSNSVFTEDNKKFWRRAKSWLWKKGTNTFVVFLGKVGRGVTYRLEKNKKDADGKVQLEKLGSLYEGLKHCLGVQDENELTPQTFTPESLKMLKESEIFICIDLENDPSDVPLEFNEESAINDADKAFSDLIGDSIREKLATEDWIRNAGLMAMGATALFLAQNLGFL